MYVGMWVFRLQSCLFTLEDVLILSLGDFTDFTQLIQSKCLSMSFVGIRDLLLLLLSIITLPLNMNASILI